MDSKLAPVDYPQTQGKSNLFRDITQKYEEGVRARSKREADWYIAKEFYRGNQYNVWVEGRGVVEPPRDARWLRKARLVYNKCRIDLDTILAYLLKNNPTFEVAPNSGEPEDQAAALCARRVLYHYWNILQLQAKLERAGQWAGITGACLWKIGWNPLAGPQLPNIQQVPVPRPVMGPDGQPMVGADGLPMMELATESKVVGMFPGGDVRVDVVSPFEFIPDEGAETLEDCTYAIHATMVPVDEMRRLYPERAADIKPDKGEQKSSFISKSLQSFGLGNSQVRDRLDRVLCLEYWARPSDQYPDGLRVVATKGTGILEAKPTPPGYDHIPFAMWSDRPVPGEFWPDGTLRDAIPLQKELNKRLSQAVDIANRFKMKWVVAEGSVSENQINDIDGEIIEYTGTKPDTKAPPGMPEVLMKLVEFSSTAIDESTGAVAVLQGKSDGEDRSGRQVAYKGQYGETRISRLAGHLAQFLSRAGQLILKQVAANVDDRRLGRLSGKNRQIETFYFKGSDINDNTNVTVEVGSLLGFTLSERFDKLMQLADRKIIDPNKVLDNLEMNDFYPLTDATALHRNNALQENESWSQGKPPMPPKYYEDARIHLEMHNLFRNSTAYKQLDPEMQAAVDMHCHDHEEQLLADASRPPGLPPLPPAPMAPPAGQPGPGGGPSLPEGGGPPPGLGHESPMGAALKESGHELAEGLPPVPAVPDIGPEQPPGVG